ncbi:MAG TPA: multicopper oxidase family protein [Negativicutes bacterium]|jgi:FtsP/CotA-like multicopper oxidase with cupredoxin domain
MKWKAISRRKFLALASIGAAGTYVEWHAGIAKAMMGGGGMGCGPMVGGGISIINPPVGNIFPDLPEATKNSDGVFEITAQEAQVKLNGTTATLLTYNGSFPGPVIRAGKGETLKLNFKNSLPATDSLNFLGHQRNITNIHTHGLHVSPKEPADAMMIMLKPGQSYSYVYDLSKEEPGHLNFYHPHVHGTVAEQYWAGLVGPLVIKDENALLSSFETHVMVIKDMTLSGSLPSPYTSTSEYMKGKEGNMVMVNGEVNPVLSIRPGQIQRWQLVNACNARFVKLSLEKHSMYLIGTDGGLLDKPYQQTALLLAPGERIDILVKASQIGGSFKLLSLPYDRGCSTLQQVTLLTLSYNGPTAQEVIPGSINPAAARKKLDTSKLPRRQMTLSMMMGKGYINGQSFTDMDHCYSVMSQTGSYEIWEIINQSNMDHPFHQHVNSCQVLSISGGDSAYASLYTTIPAWKDVVIVPKMGKATLLVPVMDYEGMTMFHCHIIEHEDIGMMGAWDIMSNM